MKKRKKSKLYAIVLSVFLMLPFQRVKALNNVITWNNYGSFTRSQYDISVINNTVMSGAYLIAELNGVYSGTVRINFTQNVVLSNYAVVNQNCYISGSGSDYIEVSFQETSNFTLAFISTKSMVSAINIGSLSNYTMQRNLESDNSLLSEIRANTANNFLISGISANCRETLDLLRNRLTNIYNETQLINVVLPEIRTSLKSIDSKMDQLIALLNQNASNNNYNDTDTIYCGISDEVSLPNSSTWSNINKWYQLSQVGAGFTIDNGNIKVSYDGYVMIWNRIYTDTSTNSSQVSASYQVGGRWLKNGVEIPNSYYNQSSLKWTQLNNICMSEVKKDDILQFQARFVGVPGYIYANSNCIIQYLPRQLDYSDFFGQIINNQMEQTEIMTAILNKVYGIDIEIPEIESVNQTINNYNNDIDIVNNITNQFNTDFETNKENLDFTPLQIGDGLRNASNLYTHIFEGLITNDYMKGVFTFAMLIGIVILIFR